MANLVDNLMTYGTSRAFDFHQTSVSLHGHIHIVMSSVKWNVKWGKKEKKKKLLSRFYSLS